MENSSRLWSKSRVRTPTVIQMEAVECGAAALAMILGYYGRIVPLEELRVECGVSRDGSKASNMIKAARKYGLEAKGYRQEPEGLHNFPLPMILFWNFNHFVVLEGIKDKDVYINDPGSGPRKITYEDFDDSFTGVVLTFKPGPDFKKGGEKPNIFRSLAHRLVGCRSGLVYVVLAGLFLVVPGLVIPTFSRVFVDDILIGRYTGWLKPLLLAMLLTAVLRAFLTWLQQYYLLRLETRLAITSSSRFFRQVFRLPIEFFSQRMAGDVGNRVLLNDKIAQLLSGQLATNVIDFLMIFFYAALMVQYDVILTAAGVIIALFNLGALRYVSRKRTDLNQQLQQETGKLMGVAMSGLQMIETLKATGSEADFFAQWSGYQAKVVNAQQRLSVSSQLLSVVPPFLMALNTVAILSLGGLRVMQGHLSMGMLVAFQSLMASFMSPVTQLVNLGGTLQETQADMNRLDDIFLHPLDKRFLQENPVEEEPHNGEVKLAGHL